MECRIRGRQAKDSARNYVKVSTEADMTDENAKSEQERHFETLRREIAVATREQGDDAEENYRLRNAIRRARASNMPDEQIDRARAQGRGEAPVPDYAETLLEGYGPDGVAVMVELITDDPHRSAHQVAELFAAHGGNVGDDGCVAWQFRRRGLLEVDASDVDDADTFMLTVIEMGGDELQEPLGNDGEFRVYCDATEVDSLVRELRGESYPVSSAAVVYEATQRVPLESDRARNFLGFFEKLRGREDVREAYANWESA